MFLERIFGRKRAAKNELLIEVTERGFEPALIRVPRNETVTLTITRTTDRTCARDFVLDALGIRKALPLGKRVEVTVTPDERGLMKFGCAMGTTVNGVLVVV